MVACTTCLPSNVFGHNAVGCSSTNRGTLSIRRFEQPLTCTGCGNFLIERFFGQDLFPACTTDTNRYWGAPFSRKTPYMAHGSIPSPETSTNYMVVIWLGQGWGFSVLARSTLDDPSRSPVSTVRTFPWTLVRAANDLFVEAEGAALTPHHGAGSSCEQ